MKDWRRGLPGSLTAWFVLLAAVFLLYGVNFLFARDLWVQDEARYGEVVREMTVNGSYIVPTLDGRFYPDKPPLYFWIMAVQGRLSGLNERSFRLVTFFSMLGYAAAFFVFARRLMGEDRGLWAAIILLTSMLSLIAGNIVRMDLLMGFFVLLSLYYLIRAVDEAKPRLSWAGYGFAILATMVKGPLGFAFPVLAAMAYAAVRNRMRGLAQLRLTYGLGLVLMVGGFWIGYLYLSGRHAYLKEVLFTQLWGRSVKSWSHQEPPYFYALVLLPLFMPWLPFLWCGFRHASWDVRGMALCWFLPGFVLISAVSGKLFIYLVPILPPLALLVAAGLPAPWEKPLRVFATIPGFVNGLFFVVIGGGLLSAIAVWQPSELRHLAVLGVVPLILGIVLIILSITRKEKAILCGLLVGSCLFSWLEMGWGAAQLNDYLSTRQLGVTMAKARKAGYELVAADIARGTISFYAGSEVRNLGNNELSRALDEPGFLAVAVCNKRRHRIPSQVLARLTMLKRFPRLGFDGYTLYIERDEGVKEPTRLLDAKTE
jgi:4-amino-4-deoxy-L-arabinose transferase-like glycosyltransferase